MKSNAIFLLISSFLFILSSTTNAQTYSSSQTYSNHSPPITSGSYYSNQGNTVSSYSNSHRHPNHHSRNHFSISIGASNWNAGAFAVPSHAYYSQINVAPPYFPTPTWFDIIPNGNFPAYTVVGGGESGRTLFICRGYYKNNLYPGKFVDGRCNISWNGHEIALSQYQLLVSNTAISWVASSNGFIPFNALPGGYENGQPLFICQAQFRNGIHPGRISNNMCHISWGGKEFAIPYYNVLVS